MKIGFYSALTLGLLLAGAQERASAADCSKLTTQMDLNFCEADNFAAADKDLNATYKALSSKLDAHELDQLKAAQRAWVTWRDAECVYQTTDSEGGSIHSMEVSMCQTDLTTTRTKQLKAQIACPAGNLACPAN